MVACSLSAGRGTRATRRDARAAEHPGRRQHDPGGGFRDLRGGEEAGQGQRAGQAGLAAVFAWSHPVARPGKPLVLGAHAALVPGWAPEAGVGSRRTARAHVVAHRRTRMCRWSLPCVDTTCRRTPTTRPPGSSQAACIAGVRDETQFHWEISELAQIVTPPNGPRTENSCLATVTAPNCTLLRCACKFTRARQHHCRRACRHRGSHVQAAGAVAPDRIGLEVGRFQRSRRAHSSSCRPCSRSSATGAPYPVGSSPEPGSGSSATATRSSSSSSRAPVATGSPGGRASMMSVARTSFSGVPETAQSAVLGQAGGLRSSVH